MLELGSGEGDTYKFSSNEFPSLVSVIALLTEVQLLVQVLILLISKVVVCGTLLLRSHPECQCYVQPRDMAARQATGNGEEMLLDFL